MSEVTRRPLLLLVLASFAAAQDGPAEGAEKPAEAAEKPAEAAEKPSEAVEGDEGSADAPDRGPMSREEAAAMAGRRREEKLPPDLADAFDALDRFDGEVDDYRRDMRRLMEHQRDRKQREILRRYQPILKKLRLEERQRREDAIERFEEFLGKYPDNPRYTPDALFRLAELHFEKSNDEYITASEEYDTQILQFDAGKLETEPVEPRQDYRKTISLFDRLIVSFPKYRNIDGALYLKGYCLAEMGEEDRALAEFQRLVAEHPNSRFAPETWLRVGEYYFDNNKLPEAIAAYLKVVEFKDSPYFDKGLYKLAWTYYRDDKYVEAIARFRELIEYSDEQAKKTGVAGSVLRAEAVQYLAVSLQEEDWDGDGIPDEGAGFDRVLAFVKGDKPYDVEILRALAQIFFDNAKYEESVATTRHLLRNFPNHAENPELHAQMVTALERLQRNDEAFGERANLARAYGEGSEWFEANSHDPEALAKAEELAEDALIQAAQYHHSRAQQLKAQAQGGDAAAEDEAIREYRLAAVAYDNYLRRYPKSENAYTLNFLYAECLYYSFRFPEAADQYAKVRDSKLGSRYQEPAAFSAILAIENDIKQQIQEGRLPRRGILVGEAPTVDPPPVGESDEDYAVREVPEQEIPDAVQALLAERTKYVEMDLKSAEDKDRPAKIAYKVGEAYYDYKHFEEARKWFRLVLQKYPKSEVAKFAFEYGMDTYTQANDYQGMGAWAAEMEGVAQVNKETLERITTIKLGAEFRLAERLFKEKKFEAAAKAYLKLVQDNPGNRYADAALNNAAFSLEKTRRFESATAVYERIYTEYPQSEYAEHALFQVAVNSYRFYNYEKAVTSYLLLIQRYPDSENAPEALYRAAVLQEQTQEYRAAAANFERYAKTYPDKEDSPEIFFRAGGNFAKLKDERNEIRIIDTFVQRYGADPKENKRVIEGLARIAEIHFANNKLRDARRAWQRVIDEFNRRGLQPGSFEARYPAEAQFRLIEIDFEAYKRMKFTGNLRTLGKQVANMKSRAADLTRKYSQVIPYKSFEWSLAAFYRMGQIFQLFATALYEAPIPKEISADPDAEDEYRTQLEDFALPIEDEAVKNFEGAYAKAREFRVANEWTKKILIALNKYKPSDYPLFKEERRMSVEVQRTPPRLLRIPPPVEVEVVPEEMPEDGVEGEDADGGAGGEGDEAVGGEGEEEGK